MLIEQSRKLNLLTPQPLSKGTDTKNKKQIYKMDKECKLRGKEKS